MDTVSVRITYPEYKKLREIATAEGRTLTWLLMVAVRQYIEQRKKEGK